MGFILSILVTIISITFIVIGFFNITKWNTNFDACTKSEGESLNTYNKKLWIRTRKVDEEKEEERE